MLFLLIILLISLILFFSKMEMMFILVMMEFFFMILIFLVTLISSKMWLGLFLLTISACEGVLSITLLVVINMFYSGYLLKYYIVMYFKKNKSLWCLSCKHLLLQSSPFSSSIVSMFNMLLLQDMVNWTSLEVSLFHNYSLMLLSLICVGFLVFLSMVLSSNRFYIKGYNSSDMLEFTWTVVPSLLLYSLSVPSLYLMYYMESATKYDMSMKVISHQWYWSYEISEYYGLMAFDSYMVNNSDMNLSDYRLLEVDNSVVLPYMTKIRTLVTSSDVLHSWSLPSLGLKVDACPSRLNFMNLDSFRLISLYSQCSELCSVNHSFMPIHVEFLSWDDFLASNVS